MTRRRLAAALLLTAALEGWAATLEDGYDAFERGDVAKAIGIWAQLADQGDATAQLNLGQIYRTGNGVEQNDAEAVKWYVMAAQNGSKTAAANLMMMETEGRATREQVAEAFATQPRYRAEQSAVASDPVPVAASTPKSATIPETAMAAPARPVAAAAAKPETIRETVIAASEKPVAAPTAMPATQRESSITASDKPVAAPTTMPATQRESSITASDKPVAAPTTMPAAQRESSITASDKPVAAPMPEPSTIGETAIAASTTPDAAATTVSLPETAPRSAPPESWISGLAEESLVIQLLKSANAAPLTQYWMEHLASRQTFARIVPTMRGRKREFLLLLGPYSTRQQADLALQRLPAAVREGMPWAGGQPWIRTAKSVQRISD